VWATSGFRGVAFAVDYVWPGRALLPSRPVSEENQWRRCNACKKPIEYGAQYWVCNVSTCNRKRTGLAFCSVSCWEVHLPVARHRESWAEERTAPTRAEAEAAARGEKPERRARRRIAPGSGGSVPKQEASDDVLIIASRLKDYVRARSGFNTSDRVLAPLSEIVRRVCDEAIRNARSEGRRTLLERDVPE
jgi:hypothetical protein